MMKTARTTFLGLAMALGSIAFAQQEIVDLSTGVINGTNTLIALGANDDTWTVTTPANTVIVPRACTLSAWQNNNCSRWISPAVSAAGQALTTPAMGTYTYNASFGLTSTSINCARLLINSMGADNRITGLSINGNAYALTLPAGDHFGTLIGASVININPAHLNANATNTVSFTVYNASIYSGFNLCASLEVNLVPITPEISGPSAICEGSALSFTGYLSPGSGTPTHYLWGIQEADASGNPVPGGYNWEFWYVGIPGPYTFPASVNPPCGRYYRIRLAAVYDNACPNWYEKVKVIFYSCKPTANAGPDQTICEGECTTIGSLLGQRNVSYGWSIGAGRVFSTALRPVVCPEVTTTYTLTATNQYGCSSTDQVTVTVLPNNPRFNVATNVSNSNYFTVTATPVVLNAHITQPGFGDYWGIDELDNANNILFSISNPSQWWIYPSANTFRGFDHFSNAYSGTVTLSSIIPTNGRFLYNRKYRISRGTWNDDCGWNAFSYILTAEKSALGEPVITLYETEVPADVSAKMAEMATEAGTETLRVFPNPGSGIFNVELNNQADVSLAVTDLFGKQIQNRIIPAGTGIFTLDISGYARGMYLLHVSTNGKTITHKIILQ